MLHLHNQVGPQFFLITLFQKVQQYKNQQLCHQELLDLKYKIQNVSIKKHKISYAVLQEAAEDATFIRNCNGTPLMGVVDVFVA